MRVYDIHASTVYFFYTIVYFLNIHMYMCVCVLMLQVYSISVLKTMNFPLEGLNDPRSTCF